jgi:nucleoside-diphosphate-sugar epimerase
MTHERTLARRRPTLLIVGCGDVGLRVLKLLRHQWRVLALTSSPARVSILRKAGAVPLLGDLDQPSTLLRLAGLADAVLHLAPPATHGLLDRRTGALLQALMRGHRVRRLVYASTTGVYGDCQGQTLDETRRVAPGTDRARRRVDAEAQVRRFGRRTGAAVAILRIPGIYARDREGGQPRDRVARRTPVLAQEDDVYTNHIHADDLARACVAALWRSAPQRVYNVCDDTDLLMGDYFDLVARLEGLPPPPRITRAQAQQQLGSMQLSFMSESRRIDNRRLKTGLRLRLLYPTVLQGLQPPPGSAPQLWPATSSSPSSG